MSINSFTRYPIPQLEGGYSELLDSSVSDVIQSDTYEIADPAILQRIFEYAWNRTAHHNQATAPTPDELAQFAATSFSSAMQGARIPIHAQYDLQGFKGPTNVPEGYLETINGGRAVLYLPGLEETQQGTFDADSDQIKNAGEKLGLQPFVSEQRHMATFSTMEHPKRPGMRYYRIDADEYAQLPLFKGELRRLGISAPVGGNRVSLAEHFTEYRGRLFGWSLTDAHTLHPEFSLDQRVARIWIQSLIEATAHANTDPEDKKRAAREQYEKFVGIESQINGDWPAFKATRAAEPKVIAGRQASVRLLRQWRNNPDISVAIEHDPDRVYGSFAHRISLSNTISIG